MAKPNEVVKVILQLAKQEAERLGEESIDSGHLLLAILKHGNCVASRIVNDVEEQISLESIRVYSEEFRPEEQKNPFVRLPSSKVILYSESDLPEPVIVEKK